MKKSGFTLAEVLITLGIIGVVTAITMPVLINGHRDKAMVTHLKKSYSTISNAFYSATEEYGSPLGWGLGDRANTVGRDKLADIFSNYLDVVERDENANLRLKDGTIITFYVESPNCSYRPFKSCFQIYVTLPEAKENNSFPFAVTETKLIPYGDDDMMNDPYWSSFEAYKAGRCSVCFTGWVLKYENLDYLRCPDKLSWTGKHSCK